MTGDGDSDLEVIRELYDATNARDWDRAIALYAADIRMEIPEGLIDSGVFEGVEEVTGWYSRWFSSFDGATRFENLELAQLEDGRIRARADHHARGRSSGIEVTQEVVWMYRVAGGRITEMVGYNPSAQGFDTGD